MLGVSSCAAQHETFVKFSACCMQTHVYQQDFSQSMTSPCPQSKEMNEISSLTKPMPILSCATDVPAVQGYGASKR
jgi:hypothetical protein